MNNVIRSVVVNVKDCDLVAGGKATQEQAYEIIGRGLVALIGQTQFQGHMTIELEGKGHYEVTLESLKRDGIYLKVQKA